MEWQVRYEPRTRRKPWTVYKMFNGQRVLDCGFFSEEEARQWANTKQRQHERPEGESLHKVDEASIESFPASDPPAWIKMTTGPLMKSMRA